MREAVFLIRTADRKGAQGGSGGGQKGQNRRHGGKNRRIAPPMKVFLQKICNRFRGQREGEAQQKRKKKRV